MDSNDEDNQLPVLLISGTFYRLANKKSNESASREME